MGLFDKLKNAVTGGGAKVYVDAGSVTRGQPFEVTVRAQIDDADLKCDRVYLKLEGIEEAEVPDTDIVREPDGDTHHRRENVRARGTTFEVEIHVAPGDELKANQSYEWTAQTEIPASANPEYTGRYAKHYYHVFAGLDCFGNDPDSGWVRLNVQ